MNSLRPVLAAIVTAALVVPAAASAHPRTDPSATMKSESQTMTLQPGQRLTLTLLECGSCGYTWQTEDSPDSRILTRKPTVVRDGRRVLRYRARARGTTTLKLVFQRPSDQTPLQRYTLTVKVR